MSESYINKPNRPLQLYALIFLCFLYIPVLFLPLFSFNDSIYVKFPMEGFTLALDFPHAEAALKLIARLNEMTQSAGGRVYFAKDSTLSAEAADAMYPDLPDWREGVAKVDPDRLLETSLIRRLKLRDADV